MRVFIFGEKRTFYLLESTLKSYSENKYASYFMLLISCIFLDGTSLNRRNGRI